MADTWECAYAAGLFDGEGCVQLYMKTKGTHRDPEGKNSTLFSRLSIAGVDPAPLVWLIERWGGKITVIRGKKRLEAGHRPLAMWCVQGKKSEQFGRDVYPFLIIKREEMDLWLRAREMTYPRGYRGHGGRGLPIEEIQARRAIVDEIKKLKRKPYDLSDFIGGGE